MMKRTSLPIALACLSLATPLIAQSNAESELVMIGDILGGSLVAEIDGLVANKPTYLVPSLNIAGSNYLVNLSGDPNDVLTVGLDLAANGTFFTTPANSAGHTTFNLAVPNFPALLDSVLYFQAFNVTAATTFEKFSNYAAVSVNQANRWQDLIDAPLASANLSFTLEQRDAQGLVKSVFITGGGPFLLTDEFTPYPTLDQAWRYNSFRETYDLIGARMHTSRAFHNSVTLQDGRIMVIGGITGPFGAGPYYTKVLNDAEIYDQNRGIWTVTPAMSSFRAGATASVLPDGRVLVAGGTKGDSQNRLFSVDDILTTSLRSTEIYDPVSNSWSAGPDMPEPKAGASAITLNNNEVMIAGGITFVSIFGIPFPDFSDQVVFYAPASNSFRSRAMAEKRALFGMTKLNDGRVLLAGGAGGNIFSIGPLKKCEVYDPATNSFTSTPPLSTAVAFSGCVTLPDGRALIIGGATGDLADPIPVNNVWAYDPSNNTLQNLAPMKASHGGNVVAVTGSGNLLVAGGESNSGTATVATESYSW
jgi:Kelch motif protein/galactose oxidase-like protein